MKQNCKWETVKAELHHILNVNARTLDEYMEHTDPQLIRFCDEYELTKLERKLVSAIALEYAAKKFGEALLEEFGL